MKPLRIGSARWELPLVLAFFAFFIFLAVSAVNKAGNPLVALPFLFILAQMVFVVLKTGPLEMSDETVRHLTPLKPRELRWDEVRRIEVSNCVVLHGETRQLQLPSIERMRGADKPRLVELFQQQIAARQIPVVKSGVYSDIRWQQWSPEPDTAPLRVDFPRWVQLLPFKIAAFALVSGLFSWIMGTDTPFATGLIIPPLLLSIVAAMLFLFRCRLEMNKQFVRYSFPYAMSTMLIGWDKVESVYLCDTVIVQYQAKKLLLPDLDKCEGADKAAMIQLFEEQVVARGITVTHKRAANRTL